MATADPKRPILALLFGLVGGGLTAGFGLYGLYQDWQFSGTVAHTEGLVENLQVVQGGKHASHFVTYAYRSGDQARRTRADVGQNLYYGLRIGEEIPVEFLSSEPSVSRIDDRMENARLLRSHEFSVGFGALFIGICFYAWRWGNPRQKVPINEVLAKARARLESTRTPPPGPFTQQR